MNAKAASEKLASLRQTLETVASGMLTEQLARQEALGLTEENWDSDRRSTHLAGWRAKIDTVKDRIGDVSECLRDFPNGDELGSGFETAIRSIETAASKYTDYAPWSIPGEPS